MSLAGLGLDKSSLKKALIFTVFPLLMFFTQMSYAVENNVRMGILAMWGEKITRQMWQPTIDYLNKTIPNHNFILKPLKLDQTADAVKQNNIDFILTNPGNYIELEAGFGISRLATLKTKYKNKSSSQFGAVIFTRNNRDEIQTLEDLRNKSFMGVGKNVFAGFQMAWLELKNQDIDPFEDFSSLQFSGHPQDKIVYAVLNGKVDAGTVRTTTLERMAAEGLIDINDFKIINRKINNQFPYIHSTQLYPEWPIAKLKNTSSDLSKSLTIALLNMPADSTATKLAQSAEWTVPLDYLPVRNLFKELNLAPYKIELPNFFERYWGQSLLFLILILQPLYLYILKLRKNLRIDEEKLAQSETEWTNALNFLDEPMYMVDLEDRIIRANNAFYKKVETKAEYAIGKKVTDFTHPEGEENPCKVCQARKDQIDTIITLEADDPVNKARIPMEISVQVIRNGDNQAIGIIQKMHDLTKARNAEKILRRSETLFRELLNATPDPLVVSNSEGTITLVNSQFENKFGYSRDEIIGQQIEILVPEKQHTKHQQLRSEFSFHPDIRPMGQVPNLVGVHKNGQTIPLDISLSPFTIDNETFVISTMHDKSHRIEKEKELKRLASIPQFNPNPIIEFKREKKDIEITYLNQAAIELFPNLTKLGKNHGIFINIEELYPSLEKHHELIIDFQLGTSTFEQKLIYEPESKLFKMYIWDITRLRNLTQEMTYQATHDSLTKLKNRREFERQLKHAVTEAQYNNKTHSLCYMDLDKFKAVNDSCGHAAGDELLKQLSLTIKSKTRETDTLARLGGDEFGLLLASCPTQKAKALADDIRKSVEKFRFHWDNKTFKIGISIGIVTINKKSGAAKEIMSAADTACYLAKEQGRNRIHIYKTDSTEITHHANQTNWLNRINTALDNNNFILYFQQIASLNNKKYQHYEVLIRMIDEDGKTIPPNSFIPTAEKFDIISSIDSWVIKNTLLIMQENRYSNINFSINLSGQSLSDLNFMNQCIAQIAESEINTARLCFEITETAMIANLSNAIRSVSTLRGLGCKIALDDFGSGLSSFTYLKNLPVDYLKIDGSLIRDMENDPINITMVESIIHIGHSMGLKTIAEYVENEYILELLRQLDIDYVQGYGIAKPVPLDDIKIEKNHQLIKA
ncbi:MAG: EAL domain-containing protein [Gammaproteobacteria bacterium]|nr:EAL domain-containing protein [Gammaproteobacteria bacterium]